MRRCCFRFDYFLNERLSDLLGFRNAATRTPNLDQGGSGRVVTRDRES